MLLAHDQFRPAAVTTTVSRHAHGPRMRSQRPRDSIRTAMRWTATFTSGPTASGSDELRYAPTTDACSARSSIQWDAYDDTVHDYGGSILCRCELRRVHIRGMLTFRLYIGAFTSMSPRRCGMKAIALPEGGHCGRHSSEKKDYCLKWTDYIRTHTVPG